MLGLITFLPVLTVFWWGEIVVLQTPHVCLGTAGPKPSAE